jgi:hemerythrin-like domain-containing protein
MSLSPPSLEATPKTLRATLRQPRFDVFGPVHKSLRCALAELLVRMGRASFDDEETVTEIVTELDDVLDYCRQHIDHEERIGRPALGARVTLHAFDAGHPAHLRAIAELGALSNALIAAPSERRVEAGRALYLHYSAFVGDTLLHFAEEECVLQPLLHRTLSDGELAEISRKTLESMTPAQLAATAGKMLRALNRAERTALVSNARASVPRNALMGLLESARGALSPDAFRDLAALLEGA